MDYRSSVMYQDGGVRAAAVYCSDGRFGAQCEDFLRNGLEIDRFDLVVLPGGPARLAGYEDPDLGFCVLAYNMAGSRTSPPHDHGDSWAVYGQAQGYTDMTIWSAGDDNIEPIRSFRLDAGQAGLARRLGITRARRALLLVLVGAGPDIDRLVAEAPVARLERKPPKRRAHLSAVAARLRTALADALDTHVEVSAAFAVVNAAGALAPSRRVIHA